MLDAKRCRRIISECLPELTVRAVRYFASGWDYELWEVNDDLLFRFPQRKDCAGPLMKERRLLAELADTLSVAVPRPEYVAEGCEAFPMPFFAYRKLAGLPLEAATLDEQHREAIAGQLGSFLSELHRFPPERAAKLGVPRYSAEGWRQYYADFREQCGRDVSPLLSADERDRVEAFWESFLGDDRYFRFQPVLIHADLGLEHILLDQEREKITGVIDFADASVGDPALDFVGIDEGLRQAALASYNLPIDDTLLSRADWYWNVGPFYEVTYGLQIEEDKYVQTGLEGIRRRVTDAPR